MKNILLIIALLYSFTSLGQIRISELPPITNVSGSDVLPIVDVSDSPVRTKKITINQILSGISSPVTSVNGKTGEVVINKTDLGLGNVDNTSDLGKPISTATQSALNTKEGLITSGTTTQYYRGDKTWQTLNKSSVGLGNVDNTTDLNKPISTATQSALNLKANIASPTLTGDPKAPTPTAGDNDTSIATTAFVKAAIDAGGGGGGSTPDATDSIKGKLKLAGDLSGTADLPTVPGLLLKADKSFIDNANLPIIKPTLLLDFANSKTLDPRVDFARPSIRTCINAFGLIVSLAINEPCFDHDPETLESKGILIEESRANLFEYSNQFNQAYWSKTRSTVVANAGTGPDGSLTAWKLSDTTENDSHFLGKSFTPLGNTTYTLTVFVKKYEGSLVNHARIQFGNFSNQVAANAVTINLLDGTHIATDLARSRVKGINGGYLVSTTVTTIASPSTILPQVLLYDGSTAVYAGDGNGSILVSDFQLEVGSFPTSTIYSTDTFTSRASTATYIGSDGLIKTAAINEARYSYNPENLNVAPKLLLEGASTNLLTYSEDFSNGVWAKTGSSIVSSNNSDPSGGITATKFREGTTTGVHLLGIPVTETVNKLWTVSAFVKSAERENITVILQDNGATTNNVLATFRLSDGAVTALQNNGNGTSAIPTIVRLPNGWYRVSISGVPNTSGTVLGVQFRLNNGSTTSYTGDNASGLYIWGAQLEEGYGSSYIPTTTVAVTRSTDVSTSAATTRSADLASITGANFSSWYRQDEGTFVGRAFAPSSPMFARVFHMGPTPFAGGNNEIEVAVLSAGGLRGEVFSSGNIQAALTTTPIANTTFNFSFGIRKDDLAMTVNGLPVTTDTSASLPLVNQISFGSLGGGAFSFLNGHISNLRYYPKRLTNSELQAVTK